MRVGFDSRPVRDVRGIGRYASCLLDALRADPSRAIVETHRPVPRHVDVFHSPWIDGAQLRPPVPTIVTLHDLVPLKRRGEYLRSGLRFKLRYLAVQRAARVIVPTAAVADDAMSELEIPAERICVIGEAAAPAMRVRSAGEIAIVRERYGLPPDYLVWVGGLVTPDPRKRVAALLRAQRTLPLVLVGPTGTWARELESLEGSEGSPPVVLTDLVDDDELAAIYTGARALVFPSDDEGFGLPPIEALACGTPVAACDVPAIREVLVDRAALCPVADLDELVRTAEALTRPAPAATAFSWSDAAEATWQVYEEALAAPVGGRTRRKNQPATRRKN
jgi:alpha-1,3-rhamnosyl/mannosyltransferase